MYVSKDSSGNKIKSREQFYLHTVQSRLLTVVFFSFFSARFFVISTKSTRRTGLVCGDASGSFPGGRFIIFPTLQSRVQSEYDHSSTRVVYSL